MNRFCSIFSQLLQLFPRIEFQHLVTMTQAERHAKGFTCWGQFVSMLFCQLGRAHSLREITGGLRSCEGKLKHLGITAPSHSTLAYANETPSLGAVSAGLSSDSLTDADVQVSREEEIPV